MLAFKRYIIVPQMWPCPSAPGAQTCTANCIANGRYCASVSFIHRRFHPIISWSIFSESRVSIPKLSQEKEPGARPTILLDIASVKKRDAVGRHQVWIPCPERSASRSTLLIRKSPNFKKEVEADGRKAQLSRMHC